MNDLAQHFSDLATKFGPQVIGATFSAVRISAVMWLIGALVLVGASIALAFLVRAFDADYKEKKNPDARDAALFVGTLVAFTGILGLWILLNPWTWVMLFRPEIWLAKQTFGL
jgi:formate hydrogenlyase subunit 3/multisubunit Na+/H+ antiporter MnhD subunit